MYLLFLIIIFFSICCAINNVIKFRSKIVLLSRNQVVNQFMYLCSILSIFFKLPVIRLSHGVQFAMHASVWEIPYNQVCFHRIISVWNFKKKDRPYKSSYNIFDNSINVTQDRFHGKTGISMNGICIYCSVNVKRKGYYNYNRHNYSRMKITNAEISFKIISYIFSQIFIIYACVYNTIFYIMIFIFSKIQKKR